MPHQTIDNGVEPAVTVYHVRRFAWLPTRITGAENSIASGVALGSGVLFGFRYALLNQTGWAWLRNYVSVEHWVCDEPALSEGHWEVLWTREYFPIEWSQAGARATKGLTTEFTDAAPREGWFAARSSLWGLRQRLSRATRKALL